jgi:hypothetical protein
MSEENKKFYQAKLVELPSTNNTSNKVVIKSVFLKHDKNNNGTIEREEFQE